MLIENAVREIDEWAIRGERMPKLMRARIFRDSAFGNRMIWEGVDLRALSKKSFNFFGTCSSNLENYGRMHHRCRAGHDHGLTQL